MVTVQEKIDVLKMARGFIQEPGAWVKGSHAQDDRGEEIAPEERCGVFLPGRGNHPGLD